MSDKNSENYRLLIDSFNAFNLQHQKICLKLQYIEFHIDCDNLLFDLIPY